MLAIRDVQKQGSYNVVGLLVLCSISIPPENVIKRVKGGGIKLEHWAKRPATLLKTDSNTGVFL